ncbi:hypothetical protein [Cohaesibacter intestini]|uniref:capsular polysaccharide export protein, LipB/KpsS family n=1 Tax=Cohaesibacter intestini TaxID=2211145 RepID=UPI000DE851E3|nr:hypothetical protein [Cohaesibacter intestini]
MALDSSWQHRPAVIYGLMRWNRKALRGMLSDLPGEPIFARSFNAALTLARKHEASLFAWATRLSASQRQACHDAAIPLILIEDGFIRSVGLGAAFVPAASLIFDAQGIYYDPSGPSDLEWMLEHQEVSPAEKARGAEIQRLLVEGAVSKYNLDADSQHDLDLPADREVILVPGQVSDDASILTTQSQSLELVAGANPNLLLLERVRRDNPDAFILFKPHPDVQSGLRNGALSKQQLSHLADLVVSDGNILSLITQSDRVETISSLTGFEALLRNKPVVVHGLPFYSGWGVTEDHTSCARRTRRRGLDELIYLTLCAYPRYVLPGTTEASSCEDTVLSLTKLQKGKSCDFGESVRLSAARVIYKMGL